MKKTTEPARLGGELRSSQIAARLAEEMRSGPYSGCSQLPPELELARALGVSRTVVRDALSELERAGYIERVRGIGTVVNRDVASLERRLDQKVEFYRMIRAAGRVPRSDHVFVTRQEASADLALSLNLSPGADGAPPVVLYVCKRVLADDEPVLYSTDILPLALFQGQRLDTVDFSRPIFDIVAEECGIQVTSTVAHLRALTGEPGVRRQLGLGRDEALLQLDEVCYDRLCRPVLRCQTYYTDFFDFAIVRKLM